MYEVVNGEIVELTPMGAYQVWIASQLQGGWEILPSSTHWDEWLPKCCSISPHRSA